MGCGHGRRRHHQPARRGWCPRATTMEGRTEGGENGLSHEYLGRCGRKECESSIGTVSWYLPLRCTHSGVLTPIHFTHSRFRTALSRFCDKSWTKDAFTYFLTLLRDEPAFSHFTSPLHVARLPQIQTHASHVAHITASIHSPWYATCPKPTPLFILLTEHSKQYPLNVASQRYGPLHTASALDVASEPLHVASAPLQVASNTTSRRLRDGAALLQLFIATRNSNIALCLFP
eukprot:5602792-Prymnesium_polylepis.1